MPKQDVLPDEHGSRAFRSELDKLVATAEQDNTPQRTKFERLARELEVDESEAAFDEKLKRIVKTPPKDQTED
jgi:hypothetical protein